MREVVPGGPDKRLADCQPDESVKRAKVAIQCVRDVAQEFVVIHLTHGAQRSPAVFVNSDTKMLAPHFANAVGEIENFSRIGSVPHDRLHGHLIVSAASPGTRLKGAPGLASRVWNA